MPEKIILYLILTSVIFSSCTDKYDYSTYVIDFKGENKDVNQKNLKKLYERDEDDTIVIALTADTHVFYDEIDHFVKKINTIPSIDFVVNIGDFTDFGIPKQYLWLNYYFLKLKPPYFIVIGNHDLIANGLSCYKEMFGPLNFSFIYQKMKFVFINTNGMEYKFEGTVPDVSWLDDQLRTNESFTRAAVMFHISPTDRDFDKKLEDPFQKTLAKYGNVPFIAHGHQHHHEIYRPYDGGITYLNVWGIENRRFNIVRIYKNEFEIETVEF